MCAMGRRIGLMPAFQAPLEPLPGLRWACDIAGGTGAKRDVGDFIRHRNALTTIFHSITARLDHAAFPQGKAVCAFYYSILNFWFARRPSVVVPCPITDDGRVEVAGRKVRNG